MSFFCSRSARVRADRKSTRLNSSHVRISYAVFCVKKKISAVKIGDKLGVRASETAELIFDNVRVPKENVIGEVGMGFVQAMQILDGGRISIAALSCGIARGAYEASVKYAKEREQFGKPIASFQGFIFNVAATATIYTLSLHDALPI